MVIHFILFAAFLIGGLIVLARVGHSQLTAQMQENTEAAEEVLGFLTSVVDYVNSAGKDEDAFVKVTTGLVGVERALGSDNYVHGVRIAHYLLNNAPILPLAVYEMRRLFAEWHTEKWAYGVAEPLRTVLLRHLGRREAHNKAIQTASSSIGRCIAEGWGVVAGFPLSCLRAFGLLSERSERAAKGSLLFRLWSFLSAVATIAGPILSYMADRRAIDATVRTLLW